MFPAMRNSEGVNPPLSGYLYAPFMWLMVVLITVFWPSLMVLIWPFSLLFDKRRMFINRLAMIWAKSLSAVIFGFKCETVGKENLPSNNSPVIYVANHQSQVDVLLLLLLGVQFRWIAKASLFKIPIFGWAMSAAGYVPVVRGSRASGKHSMEAARKVLSSGVSMAFFPEGTRSNDGKLGIFKNGAFLLASQLGLPVVPITVVGAVSALPKGGIVPRHFSFRLVVHPPILMRGSQPDEIAGEARKVIQSVL